MFYISTLNNKVTIPGKNNAVGMLFDIGRTEKLIRITTTVDIHLLLTGKINEDKASEDDYLLKANTEYKFALGSGIVRFSLFNPGKKEGNAYIMAMY